MSLGFLPGSAFSQRIHHQNTDSPRSQVIGNAVPPRTTGIMSQLTTVPAQSSFAKQAVSPSLIFYAVDFLLSLGAFLYLFFAVKWDMTFGEYAHAHPHEDHESPAWQSAMYMNIMIAGLCINFGAAFLAFIVLRSERTGRPLPRLHRVAHWLVGFGVLGVGAAASLLLPTRYALDGYCGSDHVNHTADPDTSRVNEFTSDAKYWGLFAWLMVLVLFKAIQFVSSFRLA